jgi:hypothetical protein
VTTPDPVDARFEKSIDAPADGNVLICFCWPDSDVVIIDL